MKKAFLIFIILPLIYACGPKEGSTDAAILEAKQAVLDSMNQEILISNQQRQIDSLENETTYVSSKNHSGAVNASSSNASTPNAYNSSGRSSVPTTPVGYTKKKKGLGTPAKGAIIGAGVGAITGAIVSKKKGQGAIIGGVLGAGAGAGTGVIIDRNKKKKQQQDGVVYF